MQIIADSKYMDLSKSSKRVYILIAGVFLTIVSFLFYQNLIVAVTTLLTSILAFFILSKPPVKKSVELTEEGLVIGSTQIDWGECVAWSVVNLDTHLEYAIQTTRIANNIYYFYTSMKSEKNRDLISNLSQYIPYNQQIGVKNKMHGFLRDWGIE